MILKNEERLDLINNDIQKVISYLQNLDEYTIRWNPGVESWSIMQIAIHISDAIPFWIKELDKIKNESTKQLELGRGHFDKGRLIAISKENVDNTTINEIVNNLEKIPLIVKEALESLTEEQQESDIAEFVVDIEVLKHIEGHLHQIKRNLSDKAKHDFSQKNKM